MTTVTDLIKGAIALIASLWNHNQSLQDDNTALRQQVSDLNAAAVKTAGTTAQLQAAKDAAEAHDAATTQAEAAVQATLDGINAQQADLAQAITDHPDVPLTVAPDLTVSPATPPVDSAPPAAPAVPVDTSEASKDTAPITPATTAAPPTGFRSTQTSDDGNNTVTTIVADAKTQADADEYVKHLANTTPAADVPSVVTALPPSTPPPDAAGAADAPATPAA